MTDTMSRSGPPRQEGLERPHRMYSLTDEGNAEKHREIPCTTLTSLPLPLRSWSQTLQNRCTYDDIMSYWIAYDVITFLVDLEMYHPSLHDFLTHEEKEKELRFKPVISRQRFVLSRTILKHILLNILPKETIADIVLIRNEDGRIRVKDYPSVNISLSYSGTTIAISIGKRKLGNDIEVVRTVHDKKITSSPIFKDLYCKDEKEHIQQVIHLWTLVEAYAKLHDKNPYPLLNSCSLFRDAHCVSYSINKHSILTLASCQEQFTDALVWLDSSGRGQAKHDQ